MLDLFFVMSLWQRYGSRKHKSLVEESKKKKKKEQYKDIFVQNLLFGDEIVCDSIAGFSI